LTKIQIGLGENIIMTRQIRCVIMRGGTSKAVFLRVADLPAGDTGRTARRIMEGDVFVPEAAPAAGHH
jgi:2-methylaconitate cis-trans-isomerase PrpF